MNTEHIPKSFWHSVSVSVLIFTVGFTWIGYKSGNLTLKYKDFEMATADAKNEIVAAKATLEASLKQQAAQTEVLEKEKQVLEEKLAKTKSQLDALAASIGTQGGSAAANRAIDALRESLNKEPVLVPVPVSGVEQHVQRPLEQVQLRVDKLGEIQRKLQQQTIDR